MYISCCSNCKSYQNVHKVKNTYFNRRWKCKHCQSVNIVHLKKRKDRQTMAIDIKELTKGKDMKMTDEEIEKAVKDYFEELQKEEEKWQEIDT